MIQGGFEKQYFAYRHLEKCNDVNMYPWTMSNRVLMDLLVNKGIVFLKKLYNWKPNLATENYSEC